jgi:glycosyltransferase involved in cell wall biosynthesis
MQRKIISVNQTLPVAWELKRRWWVRRLKTWLLNRCDYHVYQTPAAKEVLMQVYNIDEKRISGAPFEAGASYFRSVLENQRRHGVSWRERIGLKNEVLYLFAGNLHTFKGAADLIEAAARLPKSAGFVCAFAGLEETGNKMGGTIRYYTDLAERLQIRDKVRFLGALSHDELASVYLGADVVVLPTRKDCFPKVLVEGALAEKPLVTTSACGAAGSMVINADNGFIVEPGKVDLLADALTKLLDAPLRERMGRRSREIVNLFCNAETETKGFVEAIRHVLATDR